MASWRELQEEIREGLEETKSRNRHLHPKRQELIAAIKQRNLQKVDRLLNQGVDPNFRDGSGSFPLHLACASRVDEETSVIEQIVERLVFVGAELEAQNRFSRLPLHVAASHSRALVQILLDKGCSVNAQDNAGCTALMAAVTNNRWDPLDTLTLLLHHNANVHLADDRGFTALHAVCQNTSLDASVRNQLALLLLQAGFSASTCDCEGKMALCYELDKLRYVTYHALPQVDLQLVETLVCAGSNLRPNFPLHQYWVRFALTTINPMVLLTLLQLLCPVLTRPSLRLINKALLDQPSEGGDAKNNAAELLQKEVSCRLHSVDNLQCICRLSIRAYLRGKLLVVVPQLPLPNKLKNFLISLNLKPV